MFLCGSGVIKYFVLDVNCLSKGIVRVWGLIILFGVFYFKVVGLNLDYVVKSWRLL